MKYRMLEAGEVIQEGDEWLTCHENWSKSSRTGEKISCNTPYRRPIPEVTESTQPVISDATAHTNSFWEYEKCGCGGIGYISTLDTSTVPNTVKTEPCDFTEDEQQSAEWMPDKKTLELVLSKLDSVAGDLMGGYHNELDLGIFQHGMRTQCNVVEKMLSDLTEQQAADEREKAIDKMLAVLSEAHSGDVSEGLRMAADLYDAGYRLTDKD